MSEMANLFHVEKVAIGTQKGIGSFKGNFKTLTLKGGDLLNNPAILDENITSMGALTFMDVWPVNEQKEYTAFKIKLERNFNGSTKNIEAIFAIDTLNMVKQNIKDCIKAGNALVARNYIDVYEQLYFDIKQKVNANEFNRQMNEVDSIYGYVKDFKVTQFSTYVATQNDGFELPIVNYVMEVQRDSFISNIRFKYNLLKKQEGLLDLNIEQ